MPSRRQAARPLFWIVAVSASVIGGWYYVAGPGSHVHRWVVLIAAVGAWSAVDWTWRRTTGERSAEPELALRVVAAAEQAGVHVRKVVVCRTRKGFPAQYVALRGLPSARTVEVGHRLVELLPPREVAALAVHEVAHRRLGHRRLTPALTVLPTAVLLAELARARAEDVGSDALLWLYAAAVAVGAVAQWSAIFWLRRRASDWERAADDLTVRYGVRADLVTAYDALTSVAYDVERAIPGPGRHPEVYARMRRLQGQASETRSA